jgi:membrane-associated phospholipid phosphatase
MSCDQAAAAQDGIQAGSRTHVPARARRSADVPRPPGCSVAASALLAVIAAHPPGSRLSRLDTAVTGKVVGSRTAAAILVARAVSALAEPGPATVLLGSAAALAWRRAGARAGCFPVIAAATGMVARRRLSELIARDRPPAETWLAEPEGYSLPSKHTALAGLAAGACVSALGARRGWSNAAALLAAAIVGASRVCLGVHWPSDVVAGWLFSVSWLDLCRRTRPTAAASASAPDTVAGQARGGER